MIYSATLPGPLPQKASRDDWGAGQGTVLGIPP
ncbi:hypothetical protein AWB67_06817 [Caballeronia terrestris]|jgi:hypothetical protein|uniref:Uncharacterized protein n=2 Tax=Caballeronia TaxID=1827195 RepID=A0A158KWJ6_9BURK|nr:hypothetical protein AWB65_05486 [Caballeronia humi]SAL84970.1 hypothetical protein AWB67_06817 [Caballeronia terrestris]